ncbi:hypothetical protein MG293_006153 [Ovis ammon polii]|uniref:Uncharacterized protein n=1 Tax=Ovis ammon polii TaxID=230172 RepID=A0AAD4UER9_OVIAM|nr:hypothetical protein MG293_006153 [Ovis ammon polii]
MQIFLLRYDLLAVYIKQLFSHESEKISLNESMGSVYESVYGHFSFIEREGILVVFAVSINNWTNGTRHMEILLPRVTKGLMQIFLLMIDELSVYNIRVFTYRSDDSFFKLKCHSIDNSTAERTSI